MSQNKHAHLPTPSIWPATVALGLALAFFGLVSSGLFILVGCLLTLAGLGGWIGELRHE